MMGHWNDGWGVGEWLVMGFGMLLFWALVVAVIVLVVRSATGDRRDRIEQDGVSLHKPGATARDILDERYARGEIDDEEYRTRRDALTSQ